MPGFLAPAYSLAAPAASCQRVLNLIAEITANESTGEPQVGYFRHSPGLAYVSQPSGGAACVRGMCQAGTPLNPLNGSGGTLFAVIGQYLYQLDSTGAPTNGISPNAYRGSVDATGGPYTSPAILLPNGNQLGIVCGGQFWCDSGAGPAASTFPPFTYTDIGIGWGGQCNVTHRTVTWLSGPAFNGGMIGATISVNGSNKVVASVQSGTQLNLTTSVTTASNVTYYVASSYLLATSIAYPFAQADVGTTLTFTVTGAFTTAGPFTIASVDAYGNATLTGTGSPAGSTGYGSTGGVANQSGLNVAAGTGTFLDTFFIVAPSNNKQIYVSAPADGTNWDNGDYATKESYPDNIGALLADHQELLVAGETHSEVWQAPSANPIFPFQPNESLAMSIGIAAPASLCSLRDGPVWIGASLRGQPVAYMAQGFVPQRISTHAMEQVWASYAICSDATSFIYELDGHEFWQISFPTGDATWTYDRTASMQFGKAVWSQLESPAFTYTDLVINGTTNTKMTSTAQPFGSEAVGAVFQITGGTGFTQQTVTILSVTSNVATASAPLGATSSTGGTGVEYHRHRANCHAYVFDKHWVGDYTNGNIYTLSDTVYQDSGQQIRRIRTLPHLNAGRLRQFFLKLQLDMATSSTPLTVQVGWSNDGGVTWVYPPDFVYTTSGATSTNLDRVSFTQLGSDDNRVFSVSVTGNAPVALMNLFIDVLQGIS